MATKGPVRLGKFSHFVSFIPYPNPCFRFGWVNASYVYGLEILNAHQRRALGAVTPYETFSKALDQQFPY